MLCKRHRPRIKPAVNHLRDTVHRSLTLRAFVSYLVNIRTVQLRARRIRVTALFGKLRTASNAFLTAALAFPYRKRRAPVAVSGKSPVLNIFQPVAETPFADRLWYPVDRIVVADQIILNFRHFNKPGLSCIVN